MLNYLEQLTKSGSEEEEEEAPEERLQEEEGMTFTRLQAFITAVKDLQKMAYDMDSSMVRSLKFARALDDDCIPYRTIFDEMKRKKKQLQIPMFFRPVVTPSPVSPPAATPSPRPSPSASPSPR